MVEIEYAYQEPEEIRSLFREYTDLLLAGDPSFRQYLDIQHYDDEISCLESKYGLPDGRLYLARWDSAAAGCAGLRKLDRDRCELKRLYVRPAFRRRQIGEALLRRAVEDARATGYRVMLLDTLPSLAGAIRLYRRFGFSDTPRYNDRPIASTVFMRLDL